MNRLLCIFAFTSFLAVAVEVDLQAFQTRRIELNLMQEVPVYKDPSLFLANFSQAYTDPAFAWETLRKETPLLTSLKGKTCLLQLGPETDFKNFGSVSRLYEVAEPRLRTWRPGQARRQHARIIPVKLCAPGYNDTLGFVVAEDLKRARFSNSEQALPPSTPGNEIPRWFSSPKSN